MYDNLKIAQSILESKEGEKIVLNFQMHDKCKLHIQNQIPLTLFLTACRTACIDDYAQLILCCPCSQSCSTLYQFVFLGYFVHACLQYHGRIQNLLYFSKQGFDFPQYIFYISSLFIFY